jgi:hypothetical protein
VLDCGCELLTRTKSVRGSTLFFSPQFFVEFRRISRACTFGHILEARGRFFLKCSDDRARLASQEVSRTRS